MYNVLNYNKCFYIVIGQHYQHYGYNNTIYHHQMTERLFDRIALNDSSLTFLDLTRTKLTALEWKRLHVLSYNNNIETIWINNQAFFNDTAAIMFLDFLKKHASVRVLRLDGNQLTSRVINTLNGCIKTLPHLQILSLDNNNLGNSGLELLCEGLENNITITKLFLHNNNFGDVGAVALGLMLKTNTTLQVLDVSENNIGDMGTCILAKVIKTNKSMIYFNINNNTFGEAGSMALCDMLHENRTLRAFYMAHNSTGDTLAIRLVNARNTTLEEIDLANNSLTDYGVSKLVKVIPSWNLRSLVLLDNKFSDAGAQLLYNMAMQQPVNCLVSNISPPMQQAFDELMASKLIDWNPHQFTKKVY